MPTHKKILVKAWAAAHYDPPPSAWVLRKWCRQGELWPPAERVGVYSDGTRYSWRRGYRVRDETTGEVIFCAAGRLLNRDASPSHLRLVRQWRPEEIERQEVSVRALVVHRDEAAEARAIARMFEACGITRPVVLTSSKAIADSGRG